MSTPSIQAGSPDQTSYNFFNAQNIKIAKITAVALVGIGLVSFGLSAHFGVIAGISNEVIWGSISVGLILLASDAVKAIFSGSTKEPVKIKVATWNLGVKEDWSTAHFYEKFGCHPAQHRQWMIDTGESQDEIDAFFKKNLPTISQEEIEESFKEHFKDMGNILCVQEAFEFRNPKQFLPEPEKYDFVKSQDTWILWNKDEYTLEYEISVSDPIGGTDDKCVHLREKNTHQEFIVASVHIVGFNLEDTEGYGIESGNNQLTSITENVDYYLDGSSLPVIIAGDFNAPYYLTDENKGYLKIGNAQREYHQGRHKIMQDKGYTTLSPEYPTNINPNYGAIPLDYVYGRGVKNMQAVGLPESLKNTWGPSDHRPVIQEITL